MDQPVCAKEIQIDTATYGDYYFQTAKKWFSRLSLRSQRRYVFLLFTVLQSSQKHVYQINS